MTDHIATFTKALGAAETPETAQSALHRLADTLIGAKLFTVMRVDLAAGLARRTYTSDAENYPGSGTKPIQHNDWFEVVHGRQELFVANTLADIAAVFPDHELIGSLGCASVINLPVLRGGVLIGTVNMLDVEGNYTAERQDIARNALTLPSLATLATVDALG